MRPVKAVGVGLLPTVLCAALASAAQAQPGEIVFAVGAAGDRFYLVRSGRLRAIAEDGSEFGRIIPGEGFGELAESQAAF